MSRPADLPGITLVPELFNSSRLHRAGVLFLQLPLWLQALTVYVASRIVSISIFAAVLRRSADTKQTDALNAFADDLWDGIRKQTS